MSRENTGTSARLKRFESDLKRKLPSFPISIAEAAVTYADLVKIQKRANEIGIPPTFPNERYLWVLKVLNNLEKWAAHIIPVNQAESVKDTIAYLKAAEQQFGLLFMRSVPLYKAIKSANRKFIRIIEEYETERDDDWVPKSVAGLPIHYLEKIVTEADLARIARVNSIYNEIVDGGYFTSQAVLSALSLLGSFHPDDLKSSQIHSLLHHINLTIPASPPCFVRVDSRVVSLLLCVVILSNISDSVTPKFLHSITRVLEDRIGDLKFKKAAEPFLTQLAVKVFPKAVSQVSQILRNKYGHRTVRRIRPPTEQVVRPFTGSGMTTRQRQRQREQSTKTRLFISPNRKILKLVSEGTKLARTDSSGTIENAIEDLRSLQNQLRQEEISMASLLGRANVRNWELGKLVPWNSPDMINHLYPLRSALESTEKELINTMRNFKFNRNIIFFRKFVDGANEELSLIRGIRDLIEFSINRSSVPLNEIEQILSRFQSPPPQSLGIVRIVHEALAGIRESLKALSRRESKSVSFVQEIFETIHSPPSVALPFVVDVSACPAVVDAKNFLDSLTQLQLEAIGDSQLEFDHFDSLNHNHLGAIWTQLHSLSVSHGFTLEGSAFDWCSICFLSHWYMRAVSLVDSNSVSDLIALHQELEISGLRNRVCSANFQSAASAVDDKIERVQSVIDQLDNGANIEECLVQVSNISFSVIENYRMMFEEYLSAQSRIAEYAKVLHHIEPPLTRLSLSSVRNTLSIIVNFESRFPANRIECQYVDEIVQLIQRVERLESSAGDRAVTESVLVEVGRKFLSPELERAGELLAKVQKLEIEIAEICKKEPGLKLGTTESPSQSFSRIFDLVLSKYDLMKKVTKSKLHVLDSVQARLCFSVFTSLTVLLRLWTQHRRDLNFANFTPRWLVLYLLRTLGSFLGASFKSVSPKNFATQMEWLTKQLNASNEILKETKKSVSDFARNRFMIPMFHFGLFEPVEKIRRNFETKLGISIKLYYKENSRQLDFICTLNPQTGKVIDRYFPKLGGAQSSLIEPESTDEISPQFEQRQIPKSLTDVLSQLQSLVKILRDDVKHAKASATTVADSRSSTPPEKSKGPMSFTKFLSSSFANISLDTPSNVAEDGNAKSTESLNDYWINNVDQIVGTGESNFFEKYLDLIEESKRARNEIVDVTAHVTAVSAAPPKAPPPASIAPPAPPPPGFARPPPSASPKNDKNSTHDKLVIWSGRIEGGSRQPKLGFEISLIPLYRSLSRTDEQSLEQVLQEISAFSLEGSMGVGKFSDYYQKLIMAASTRKRREPFSFVIGLNTVRFDSEFFASIPMNTANAFAVMFHGQKMKLWILSVDGSVDYKPLPVIPGVVFGILEVPPTVFSLPVGFVDNIHHPLEMNHLINNLNSEVEKSNICQSLYVSLLEPQPVLTPVAPPSQEWLAPPTGPVALAVPKPTGDFLPATPPIASSSAATESLARVFDMINHEPKAPLMPPPLYNPYIGSSAMTTTAPSWSRPSIVIGAPSTGPSLNELPNPRKGSCRFFNTAQGCQQGKNCKFNHYCSVCGDENHNSLEHYARSNQ